MILSEEISDDMYSSSLENEKGFPKNGSGSVPIGIPMACFIVTFPTLKKQFSIKLFIAVLRDALLSPAFVFLPQ